ncbi:MAG: hypothetical protein NTZ64_09625 [Polaromonas sp.]|nr:hypothetical protein [Polaromonas sp.]
MPFTLHWSAVSPASLVEKAQAPREGLTLLALWPAPVNPDVCFEEAGFDDFGDNDLAWDAQARALLLNAPPWYLRPFKTASVKSLHEQLEWPMQWDSLLPCEVVFGNSGAALRTGRGHYLFWVTLPETDTAAIEKFVVRVAADVPLVQTCLDWARQL